MSKEINKREVRSFSSPPQVRSAEDGAAESRTIEGYAIVFEQESRQLYDWFDGEIIEIIHRGAVKQEDIANYDVKMNINHDSHNFLLARSNKGVGSLALTVDAHGLHYRFDAPRTSVGDMVLEMVRRGDYGGSSFCFTVDFDDPEAVTYDERAAGEPLRRHVHRFNGIYDTSIVNDPAYLATSVEARSLEGLTKTPKGAEGKEGNKKAARKRSKKIVKYRNYLKGFKK